MVSGPTAYVTRLIPGQEALYAYYIRNRSESAKRSFLTRRHILLLTIHRARRKQGRLLNRFRIVLMREQYDKRAST